MKSVFEEDVSFYDKFDVLSTQIQNDINRGEARLAWIAYIDALD